MLKFYLCFKLYPIVGWYTIQILNECYVMPQSNIVDDIVFYFIIILAVN